MRSRPNATIEIRSTLMVHV